MAVVQQDGSGGLRILSAKLLQLSQGNADGYAVPYRLRLLPNHQYHINIPPTILAQIAAMPICGDHLPTEDNLRIWEIFLQIEERIAKARQFCVPFLSHNGFGLGRLVTFEIDVISATLDGSNENSLAVENFWERVKRARNEEIKLFETTPTGQSWRNSRQLGAIEQVDPNRCTIRVRLERDLADYMAAGRYQLPATGFLFFEAVGDIQQIQRKKEAMTQLRQGRTQNPYLGNFLFDASQARTIQKTIELRPEDLLLSSANPSQKAAVEMVLAAEDLVLIQGPPGTGKTTVIAEICYQVALRGGRTLITSQANLAVDNALSRLVHNPVIRAVRKGNAEKVGEEGQLIYLPSRLPNLTMVNQALPWQQSLERCQFKVNELIQKYRQWDRVSSQVSEIKNLLVRGRNLLGNRSISEADVTKVNVSKELDPVESLIKLKRLAQNSIDEIEKPLGIWGWIIEWVLAIAVNQKSLDSIAQKLCPYSRRYTAAIRLEAIRREAQAIRQRVQPVDKELAIFQITAEVVEGIVTSARTWLDQLQVQTEQEQKQLEKQLNEQIKLVANAQKQIYANQEQVGTFCSEADFKFKRAIALLQVLSSFPHLPNELRLLGQQYLYNPSNLLSETPEFKAQRQKWENHTKQLDALICSIEPCATLSTVKDLLIFQISSLYNKTETCQNKLTGSQSEIQKIIETLKQQLEYISTERTWWQSICEAIPGKFKPKVDSTDMLNLEFLRAINNHFGSWQQPLQQQENYLNRYQHFIQDWINKLRKPTDRDRNDLRRIYLDNANVVGITCVQAANYNFSQEFKYFDVVIIDEVSKCTPPELLIPALKGKKLVMVGDHRQLPPMLNTKTLEEVSQEIGSTNTELELLQESLFKIQFETADNSIKKMLNIQYRMHPIIMGAINQFYDGKLECGILKPDTKRAHNLADKIIQPDKHLIWVKTPKENKFEEESEKTSFFNTSEIDAIERLCKQFESTWTSRVANGERKKEIAVITFYGAQLRKIDERLQSKDFPSLQITTGTVDRFQGMERPVVIVSMVRNNSKKDVGFAKKPERVNVAFSRAQELLVIVGCHSLFTQQREQIGSMYSNVSNMVHLDGGFIDVSRLLC